MKNVWPSKIGPSVHSGHELMRIHFACRTYTYLQTCFTDFWTVFSEAENKYTEHSQREVTCGFIFLPRCRHIASRTWPHCGRSEFTHCKKGSCSIIQLFSQPKVSKSHCMISQEPILQRGWTLTNTFCKHQTLFWFVTRESQNSPHMSEFGVGKTPPPNTHTHTHTHTQPVDRSLEIQKKGCCDEVQNPYTGCHKSLSRHKLLGSFFGKQFAWIWPQGCWIFGQQLGRWHVHKALRSLSWAPWPPTPARWHTIHAARTLSTADTPTRQRGSREKRCSLFGDQAPNDRNLVSVSRHAIDLLLFLCKCFCFCPVFGHNLGGGGADSENNRPQWFLTKNKRSKSPAKNRQGWGWFASHST